jgi:hypothetical protein
MTKQLFIIHDKELEDQASLLYDLLSQHTDIKASIYTKKEIKKLVSREKCLYIGRDCSSKLIFDDCYNELGIHIGCKGAKAWIRCYKYEWNVDRLHEFENMLKSYTDKFNLKKEYDVYNYNKALINQQFQIGWEPWPGNAINRLRDKNIKNSGGDRVADMFYGVFYNLATFGLFYKITGNIFSYFGREPVLRWYQYFIGVLKFYEDYLNDFLELSDSNSESNDEETITESEKKN